MTSHDSRHFARRSARVARRLNTDYSVRSTLLGISSSVAVVTRRRHDKSNSQLEFLVHYGVMNKILFLDYYCLNAMLVCQAALSNNVVFVIRVCTCMQNQGSSDRKVGAMNGNNTSCKIFSLCHLVDHGKKKRLRSTHQRPAKLLMNNQSTCKSPTQMLRSKAEPQVCPHRSLTTMGCSPNVILHTLQPLMHLHQPIDLLRSWIVLY